MCIPLLRRACCGFDLCHKNILYLYLYLYLATRELAQFLCPVQVSIGQNETMVSFGQTLSALPVQQNDHKRQFMLRRHAGGSMTQACTSGVEARVLTGVSGENSKYPIRRRPRRCNTACRRGLATCSFVPVLCSTMAIYIANDSVPARDRCFCAAIRVVHGAPHRESRRVTEAIME